jgi:CopA family copper-resistance protein
MVAMMPSAFAEMTRNQSARIPALCGTEFNLTLEETPVNFTGTPGTATTINGTLPGPTLRLREGDTVTIRVTNKMSVPSSIHWHGIIIPYQMDGVPGISFPGIAPGETFTYRFRVQQHGTFWYHSHSGHQEQTGMYGALIVEPRSGETIRSERDYVVHLSDWTDDDPGDIYARLKAQGDYYNYIKPTLADYFREVRENGMTEANDRRAMWNQMRMNPTDLADLSSATLTYLMNGTTPTGNWTGLCNPGERVRLRFINGAANTFYDVRIPGLKMTVVQSDGTNIEPVSVDEFRFGPGETYDVLVTPQDDAHTIFAQSMDRTGYARGTLAVRDGLDASVPPLDKVQWLSMSDMMGNMGGMEGMNHMAGMSDMSAMHEMQGTDHPQNMGDMASMHHMQDMTTMGDMSQMEGMNHDMTGMSQGAHDMAIAMNHAAGTVRHARSEYGPSTDMRIDTPRTNLDDPGVGLRNNGRRVLTLADLNTIGGPIDVRGAEREIELHLTGNMERYTWSLDGLEFGQSTPVHFNYGERLRVTLHNDTMMTHPMHMHGMWSELEDGKGNFLARRHTIPVQPAQRLSFLVTADAAGRWAWHCHLMLHMHAGMFREVVVA